VREFNKLFTFGTVGRSTATDVLISNILSCLPEDERKIIAFSDNRQDTALQAAHLNNLQERMRRGYAITHHYRSGDRVDTYAVQVGEQVRFHVTYEHNGRVLSVNAGSRKAE
jgi:hypothetical protein